jgi:adenosylhomocysteine nucleosidase
MVFRYFINNLIREAAQEKLQQVTENAQQAAERNANQRCDVLVAMALDVEAGGFVDGLNDVSAVAGKGFTERFGRLGESLSIGVVETGIGEARARAAVEHAIAARQPQWVIAAGFAGGLNEEMKRGQFLMSDVVRQASSGDELSIGLTMSQDALDASPNVHSGRLLTVDRILRDPQEKRRLGQQHDALACDMETFGVAAACARAKVRFLSVRIISDGVDDALPKELSKLLDQENTVAQLGAAAAALWNRPSSAKDMWKLKEDALKASDRLAKFLVGVVEQLPVQPGGQTTASDV